MLPLLLALAGPKIVLAATATPVLGGHLALRLPAGARIEEAGHSLMAAPAPEEELTLAVLRRGKVRLSLLATEADALAGPDLEAGVRAELKGDPAMTGATVAPLSVAPPLRAVTVVLPPAARKREQQTLVLAAYLAHPDGSVQRAAFFVNRAGARAAAAWAEVASRWVATFTAGPRRPPAAPGEHELGRDAVVITPAGFAVRDQEGPDFTVYHLRRLVPLGAPREECGVYVGGFPSYQHEQEEVAAVAVRKSPGKLAGQTVEWHTWARAGLTTAEAQVAMPGDGERMHVFCSAATAGALDQLRAMAATIRLSPSRP
jgi:hypothetical protein